MIALEVHFFLGSFLSGVLLLAAYDVLRLLRRIVPHSRAFVNGEDILFWIGASIFIFRVIYTLNDGSIRSFGIFCMAAGMGMYHFSLSDMLVGILYRIFGVSILKLVKFIKKILKKIAKPIKMGIQRLKKFVWRKHEEKQKGEKDS